MPVDRLREMRELGGVGQTSVDRLLPADGSSSSDTAHTTQFFQSIGAIRDEITSLHHKIKGDGKGDDTSLDALFTQEHTQVMVRDEDEALLKTRIEDRMAEIHSLTKSVQSRLKGIKQETEEFEKQVSDPTSVINAADIRMRHTQQQSLLKRTSDLVADFMNMQKTYKANRRKNVARQVETAHMGASKEEKARIVDECLESGQSVFLLAMQGGGKAAAALRDVTDKHEQIMKLEKSIGEVAEMFQDLAILVESQGVMLDRIETNVSKACEFVSSGVLELEKANQYAKKNRKKKCCLVLVLMVVLLVILGPIIGSAGN